MLFAFVPILTMGFIFAAIFVSIDRYTPRTAEASFSADPKPFSSPDIEPLTISANANNVYIGGDFANIGTYIGAGAPISAVTGNPVATFPLVSNYNVFSALPDGNGGWYIGGLFDTVENLPIRNLAHILPSGHVDPTFHPDPDNDVLALVSDGTKLYLGGDFVQVGGQNISYLAAVNLTSGAVDASFLPAADQTVRALLVRDTILYAGGAFSAIGGLARSEIGAVSTIDGSGVAAFDVSLTGPGQIFSLAFSPDGTRLFAGGSFVGPTAKVVAVDMGDYSVVPGFQPGAIDTQVNALAVSSDGSNLYMAGNFTAIGSESRIGVASLSTSDGSLTQDIPDLSIDNPVTVLSLTADGGTLYIGGDFTTVGGQSRARLAAINTRTGTVDPFDPKISKSIYALSLAPDENTMYVGTTDALVNLNRQPKLAAMHSDGSFNSNFTPTLDGLVRASVLSPDGSTLYVAGDFLNVDGEPHEKLAAVSTVDGSVIPSFNAPLPDDIVESLAISPDGSMLYVGGDFYTVGGFDHGVLVALNTSDGGLAPGFHSQLDPDVYYGVSSILESGSRLYLATVSGNVLAVSAADGSIDPSFPALSSDSWYNNAIALSHNPSTLYVGGNFSTIGGESRNFLAAFHTLDGSIAPFSTPITGGDTISALAISPDDSTLYAGLDRTITTTDGSRSGIAEISTADGSIQPVSQGAVGDVPYNVFSLSPSGDTLYVGSRSGGRSRLTALSVAPHVPLQSPGVVISKTLVSAAEGGASDSYTIVLDSQPTSDVTVLANSDGSVLLTPTTLTFTPQNWDTPQTVTVSAVDNATVEVVHTATVTHSVSSADADYDGVSVANVTVSLADNDLLPTSPATTATSPGAISIPVIAPSVNQSATIPVPSGEQSASSPVLPATITAGSFTISLAFVGIAHPEVKSLQQFLNSQGFTVATAGPGSAGNETTYFGLRTKSALIKFQEAHADEILKPLGLKKGTGILGPATLRYIRSILKN